MHYQLSEFDPGKNLMPFKWLVWGKYKNLQIPARTFLGWWYVHGCMCVSTVLVPAWWRPCTNIWHSHQLFGRKVQRAGDHCWGAEVPWPSYFYNLIPSIFFLGGFQNWGLAQKNLRWLTECGPASKKFRIQSPTKSSNLSKRIFGNLPPFGGDYFKLALGRIYVLSDNKQNINELFTAWYAKFNKIFITLRMT